VKNLLKFLFLSLIALPLVSGFAAEIETVEKATDESEPIATKEKTPIEIAIANLRARVAALETELADRQLIGSHKYSGTYHSVFFETSLIGFQDFSATDIGNGETVEDYVLNQEISSLNYRTATYEATSDGSVLTIPEYELLNNELFLGGAFDALSTKGESFALTIRPDGSILLPDNPQTKENEEKVVGNLSADGSSFTILINGEESNVIVVGIRK
jgi:hypothetical protein